MAIKAILIDLGYTLIYNTKHELYLDVLQKKVGADVTLEQVDRAFHLTDKHIMRHLPGLFMRPFDTFCALYVGIVNYFLPLVTDGLVCAQGYMEKHRSGALRWIAFDGVKDTLASLRADGYKLVLVTNWDQSCRAALEETGLADCFDEIVISCVFGAEKPDPSIILHGVERAGVKKEECLFVGDNYYDDGVGSQRAGLDYVILNRFDRFGVEELTCDLLSSFNELPAYIARKNAGG